MWHIELMECEFCNIIRGTSSAEILFANRHAIAILDINPIHYGHVLVIPKTHASTFVDVPDEELAGLMHATKVISNAIMKSLNPPGFNIFSNNGKAAGQSIFHCHFHVTPRYDDDKIQFILKLKKYACGEMATYGDRIRQHINTQPIHEYM